MQKVIVGKNYRSTQQVPWLTCSLSVLALEAELATLNRQNQTMETELGEAKVELETGECAPHSWFVPDKKLSCAQATYSTSYVRRRRLRTKPWTTIRHSISSCLPPRRDWRMVSKFLY
jgi:hypothetical protein